MPLPRLFASGLWLVATTVATVMVWAATSIVAADVTDRPAPVIGHRDVVSELAANPSPAPTPPVTTTTAVTTPPTTRRAGGPTTTRVAVAPPPTATVAPTPPTTAAPATIVPVTTTTTRASSQPTATYSTAGGVVRVACSGFFITLVSAIPANGFAAVVRTAGPANVDVHFVAAGQDYSVQAVCFGQPIRY